MNELVVHHTYEHGMAFDISGHANHGRPNAVTAGAGDFAGSFQFGGESSRVVVPPSSSLQDLRSFRVRLRFYPTFYGSEEMPFDIPLVEGDLCFRMRIQTMAGTVECWTSSGDLSSSDAVNLHEWNEVELTHDGISQARVYVNGKLSGVRNDAAGSIPGIGPSGLFVGAHPTLPVVQSPLYGYVSELSLHKYNPRGDVERLVDLCCLDRATIDDLLARARKDGWDAERLGNKLGDVLDLGSEIAAAARDDDAARIEEHRRLARETALTLQSPDRRALYEVVDRYDASIRDVLSQQQLEDYGDRVAAQLADWPFSLADLVELAPAMCWERFVPEGWRPGDDKEDGAGRTDDVAETWPQGDPDTDRTGDDVPDDWIQGGEEPPGVEDDDGHIFKPDGNGEGDGQGNGEPDGDEDGEPDEGPGPRDEEREEEREREREHKGEDRGEDGPEGEAAS